MGPVKVRVPAKINLHLGVGALRPDGYHDLATIYHAIALFDELTARPADSLALTMDGEGAGELATGRVQPGDPGGSRAGRGVGPTAPGPAAPAQTDPAGGRPRRWQRRRRGRAGRLRHALGDRVQPGGSGRHRRPPRLGCAVSRAGRDSPGYRTWRDGQPGAGPRARVALGGRAGRGGPVDAGRLPGAGPAAQPRRRPGLGGYAGRDPRRAAPARRRRAGQGPRQRPGGGRPVHAAGAAPHTGRRSRRGRAGRARLGVRADLRVPVPGRAPRVHSGRGA